MKILVATGNQGKIREISTILAPLGITLLTPADVELDLEVEEDGDTFAANAIKKATAWREATGLSVLADDSGLCVDALDGRPGVRSARFSGEDAGDEENCTLLLKEMAHEDDRRARFVCVMALALADGRVLTASGECAGTIIHEPRGTGGFGYDPLFLDPLSGQTFAELDPAEKNTRSHRRRALESLREIMCREGIIPG